MSYPLMDALKRDMVSAMKHKDAFVRDTLRTVIGELQNAEKNTKGGFGDAAAMNVLAKEVKKRRDSAVIYTQAGHYDRAEKETLEANLINAYVSFATDGEVAEFIASVSDQIGGEGKARIGSAMKLARTYFGERGVVFDPQDVITAVK